MHTIITDDQGTRHNLIDPEDGMRLALEINQGDILLNVPSLAWSTHMRHSSLSDFYINVLFGAADNTLRGIRHNGW